MMSIKNTTLIPSLIETNIAIETTLDAPVKATQVSKNTSKTASSETNLEIEVLQSANVEVPANLLDGATSTYYIPYYQFFYYEIPQLNTDMLFGGIF